MKWEQQTIMRDLQKLPQTFTVKQVKYLRCKYTFGWLSKAKKLNLIKQIKFDGLNHYVQNN